MCLEQVAILVGRPERRRRLGQHQHADEVGIVQQRQHQSVRARRVEQRRQFQVVIDIGREPMLLDVDHPLPAFQEADHRRIGGEHRQLRQRRGSARPRGPRRKSAGPVVTQEQQAAGAADDLCDGADRTHVGVDRLAAPVAAPGGGRQCLDETQPLDAVIVLVAVEVLGDEHLEATPDVRRRQQRRQRHGRAHHEYELRHPAPGAAVERNQIATDGHQDQVDTDPHQRRRVEHHLARDEDVQRPLRIAARRDRQHRHCQDGHDAAGLP
jgi:hypothetical protein